MSSDALLCELFPAEVKLPDDRVIQRARVFVTDRGVIVVAQEGREAVVAYKGRHIDLPELPGRNAPRTRQAVSLSVPEGTLIARRAGCTCGSVLGGVSLQVAEQMARLSQPQPEPMG